MANKGNTETFYREIMAKVIDKMKEDFNNEGISEDILTQLKKMWEEKLIQNGIFQPKQMPQTYSKLLQHKNNLFTRQEPKKANSASFKSSMMTTTNDNIKSYLEDKNISANQLNSQLQMLQPKFYTSTLKGDNQPLNMSEPKNENKEASEEIKEIQLKEEIKEDDKSEVDSDEDVFIKKVDENNAKDKLENQNDEGDELLSPLLSDSNDLEADVKDFLLAQYEKVHRVKNKWKIHLKDAILHTNGREFVFDRVVGELDRDW